MVCPLSGESKNSGELVYYRRFGRDLSSERESESKMPAQKGAGGLISISSHFDLLCSRKSVLAIFSLLGNICVFILTEM